LKKIFKNRLNNNFNSTREPFQAQTEKPHSVGPTRGYFRSPSAEEW